MLTEEELPSDWKNDVIRGLEVIASRAEALKRFIDSYTSLAKLAPPSRRPVDAGRWVRRVAELETRVPVRVEEGPAVTLDADGDQLDQLLINLVSNAAEASINVGSEIVVGWRREGRWLVVDVLDQGGGPPDPANLFVPFFTTKPEGSGLGLVMCRQIAENHGGIVELVGRKDGEGARATVRLPA
jgi:signal transduction histidine kinase